MSLYSTIPAPEAAVDEESLLTAKPKKSTRTWASTLAAVCLASAVVGSATPGAVDSNGRAGALRLDLCGNQTR